MLSICELRKTLLLDSLVPAWESHKADLNIHFRGGEIASDPQRFYVPYWGRLFRVPPFTGAVLTYPSGRTQIWGCGDHYLNLPVGSYIVQFVNMQRQSTQLPQVSGVSRDAWGVTLKLEIIWRVAQPTRVAASLNFHQTLVSVCRAVIADYIRSMSHDSLVQVPDEPQTVSHLEITDAIASQLIQRRTLEGIEILDVILLYCQGDSRRTEVIQNAIVESKAIDTEMVLQERQTRLESQKIDQTFELLNQRREVEIAKANTERLVIEEVEQKRLRIAQIEAREAELRRSVQEQEIEFQQIANEQQLKFQELMKALEVKGEVYKQFGQAAMNSISMPGMMNGLNGGNQSDILNVMNAMIGSLNPDGRLLTNGNESFDQHSHLHQEMIKACASLKDLSYLKLETLPSGDFLAKFLYQTDQITIEFAKGYSSRLPKTSIQMDGSAPQSINIEWQSEIELVDALQEAIHQIELKRTHDHRTSGNGGKALGTNQKEDN